MNHENLQTEQTYRRFLLGDMLTAERDSFEQIFFEDEEMFENLLVAEDELIEAYLCGNLVNADKNKFEDVFLTTPKRRERVAFARQMLGNIKDKNTSKKTETVSLAVSVWKGLLDLFKQPKFALGSAFAVFVLLLGGWFLWQTSEKPVVVINTPPPTPSVSVTPTQPNVETTQVTPTPKFTENVNQANKNVNKPNYENRQIEKEANFNKANLNINVRKPPPENVKIPVSTLALFAGGVRGDGKISQLDLPKNSPGANLQLNLESQDYNIYRTEIVDQNGDVIYQSKNAAAKKAKLYTFIPAGKLKRGDYIVKVYGKKPNGQDESVADYQFRVNQK